LQRLLRRGFQTSACSYLNTKAGVPKPSKGKIETLNYEEGLPPYEIGVKKAWNSWNTTNLKDEGGASEILLDDMFIRKFMIGTWHNLIVSEITIKRRFNIITIGILLNRKFSPNQAYFLLGYTEELLSAWFKCPVKLEISTVKNAQRDMFYRNC
ncbi:hypothetical protein LOTGIDRAFT_107145, partial [Lottia gigantea]